MFRKQSTKLANEVHGLAAGRRWSVLRIGVDLGLWAAAGAGALAVGRFWATALAILWIGAVPMHDLLVHGHEGTHRLVSRSKAVNEFFTWFTHALIGISGTAYRAFHMDHHRWLGTERDPEELLLKSVVRGVERWVRLGTPERARAAGIPGWAYLGIVAMAHPWVNTYPMRSGMQESVRWRTVRDLAGATLLHGALLVALGTRAYLLLVAAPIFTSLSAAVVLRSLTEHHGTFGGDPWTNTRTIRVGRLGDWLWSNTTYHLEHHLFPFVPFHRLPAVHRLIADDLARHGSVVDSGFMGTAVPLLAEPSHFKMKGDPANVIRQQF